MQWSATHIHLAKHHDHDNSHHQHNIEAHAHLLNNHHTDNIDTAQHTDNLNVVELEYQCNSTKHKNITPVIVVIESARLQLSDSHLVHFELPVLHNNKPHHLDHATVKPRAPPRYS